MSAIEQHSTVARLFFELEGTGIKALSSNYILHVVVQYMNKVLHREKKILQEETFKFLLVNLPL